MNKKIVHDALILFAFTVVLGLLLAVVYDITKEPIAQVNYEKEQAAYRDVFAAADSFEEYADFNEEEAAALMTENGYSGTVTDVSIVSTKLTTTDNKIIVIPNGSLSNGTIKNYSQNTMRRVEWLVGVEYGTSSKDVKAALQEIVDAEKRVLFVSTGAPADPLIAVNALKDSAVEYVVRVWVKSEDYWDVYYHLNEQIYTILPTRGIGFPFPQMDVHLTRQDS